MNVENKQLFPVLFNKNLVGNTEKGEHMVGVYLPDYFI